MRVYHIVKDESEFVVGDIIQPPRYNLDSMEPKKRQIEEELEKIRMKDFPNYPSRLNCLFVCHDLDDVEFWAIQKSDIRGREFKVLTLETSEPVFWFSAESYNMHYNGYGTNLHQACMEFWKSNCNIGIEKMEDCEGITNGSAQIVEIQRARESREGGLEIIARVKIINNRK